MAYFEDKIIVGLTEKVTLSGNGGKKKTLIAKVDTGATKSSMDAGLAAELHLGPIIKTRLIKSAHGSRFRSVMEAEVEIAGKRLKTEFTIADRLHMKYHVLIGQNILKHGFLIDPTRKA